MTVNNQGNVEDNFLLEVCDGGVPGDCVTPAWSTRFTDMQGNRITQITIQPDESAEIELQVTVSSSAFEFEDAKFRRMSTCKPELDNDIRFPSSSF